MIRACALALLAFALVACAGPRPRAQAAAAPQWLEDSVAAAEARARGYPDLTDVPEFVPEESAAEAWRRNVEEMVAVREQLLADPALIDPDPDGDAVTFTADTRARADEDVERLTDDTLE